MQTQFRVQIQMHIIFIKYLNCIFMREGFLSGSGR